jgi:glutathione synthase
MDPITGINPAKDSSLAMLVEAQRRGYALWYFEQHDLRLRNGVAQGSARPLRVADSKSDWFELGPREELPLSHLDLILMRKDPPFGTEYIYTTYLLERAELAGVLVVNKPRSLRDMNEKVYTAWFPECCPETVITRSIADMRAFLAEQGHIVVKPLHGMGGRSIFVLRQGDNNANVVFETLTDYGQQFAMAQTFIPEIACGDKRIILVDGEFAGAINRVPAKGEARSNLHVGGTAKPAKLTKRDREICARLRPELKRRGLIFTGIDVIGDYLTEINVTSPTGIRQVKAFGGNDIAVMIWDAIEAKVAARAAR